MVTFALSTQSSETRTGTGCLIDVDFGGPIKNMRYPEGYRKSLGDGYRVGEAGKEIEKWHDWFALWKLIFEVHNFHFREHGPNPPQLLAKLYQMQHFWNGRTDPPSEAEIEGLKRLLREVSEEGWTLKPDQRFTDTSSGLEVGTCKGSTGSPPQKKEELELSAFESGLRCAPQEVLVLLCSDTHVCSAHVLHVRSVSHEATVEILLRVPLTCFIHTPDHKILSHPTARDNNKGCNNSFNFQK
jgi:hypothetical protein